MDTPFKKSTANQILHLFDMRLVPPIARKSGIYDNQGKQVVRQVDAYGVGTDTASLIAERLGSGNGRVYQITFLASDGKGGETIGTVNVYVPHNKKHCSCIDDGQNYDATKVSYDKKSSKNKKGNSK